MRNIILAGLEGTHKLEIGKDLALKLKMKLIDTDEIMSRESGLSLPELLNKYGVKYFRSLENKIIEKISGASNTVIVVGGGSILQRKNVKALKQNGFLISLITSKIELNINKVKDEKPLLRSQWNHLFESAKGILNLKTPGFPSADYTIDITNLSVEEVNQKIIDQLRRGNLD